MKNKDLQPRLFYPAKLSFRIKGQVKSFPDKKKLKEFIITKPELHEMLKGIFKERRKKKKVKVKTMNNKKTYLPTSESKNQVNKKSEVQNGLVNILESGT